MKTIARLLLLALIPFLPGCVFSHLVIDSTVRQNVESRAYDSTDRIEKAAVTGDDRLCLFFAKDLTNGSVGRFTLVVPRSLLRTNAQAQPAFKASGILRATNSDELYPQLSRDPADPQQVNCLFTWAVLHVPGATVQKNWSLLANHQGDLKFIPIGETLHLPPRGNAASRGLDLTLASNATATVYLTKSAPIEFGYVDLSIKRSLTIVTVDPLVAIERRAQNPQNYGLLVLAVPADIVTFPVQAIAAGLIWSVILSGPNHC